MTVSSDLLVAAGLLLATIGMVFAVWHAEMTAASNIEAKPLRDDRGPQITEVRKTLRYRAIPLDVAVVMLVAALAPPAVLVIGEAFCHGGAYDAVRTIYVLVWVLTLALGAALAELTYRVARRLHKLKGPDRGS